MDRILAAAVKLIAEVAPGLMGDDLIQRGRVPVVGKPLAPVLLPDDRGSLRAEQFGSDDDEPGPVLVVCPVLAVAVAGQVVDVDPAERLKGSRRDADHSEPPGRLHVGAGLGAAGPLPVRAASASPVPAAVIREMPRRWRRTLSSPPRLYCTFRMKGLISTIPATRSGRVAAAMVAAPPEIECPAMTAGPPR